MTASNKNTAIIIPAYNAAKYIRELVSEITRFVPQNNLIVVNDASTDNTLTLCYELNLKTVNFKVNKGKGSALIAGFRAALKLGFKFAVTIDADLQHKPEDIPQFWKIQNDSNADMIIGKRKFVPGKMPLHRICSNTLTSLIVSLVSGRIILDSQSGYRLYNLKYIQGLHFISERYQFESEVIIKYARKGAKFDFVPIETIYNGQESHISIFRDITNFVKIIIHEIFNRNGE